MITPDFDAFETQEEAIYFLHHEHADCWCEVCRQFKGDIDGKRVNSKGIPEEVSVVIL